MGSACHISINHGSSDDLESAVTKTTKRISIENSPVLLLVLNGCETSSFPLREEHGLRISEK
jgi:hypothetical protein